MTEGGNGVQPDIVDVIEHQALGCVLKPLLLLAGTLVLGGLVAFISWITGRDASTLQVDLWVPLGIAVLLVVAYLGSFGRRLGRRKADAEAAKAASGPESLDP